MVVVSTIGIINRKGTRPREKRNKGCVEKCGVILAGICPTSLDKQPFINSRAHPRSTHAITMP